MTNLAPLQNQKKIVLFYLAIVFIVSWSLQIIAIQLTGNINSNKAEGWLVATMFTPTVITIAFLIANKPLRPMLRWKPNVMIFWCILLAVLIPTVIAFAVVALVQAFSVGHSGWFIFYASHVHISGGPYILGIGDQSWLLFIANIAVTAFVYALINAIPSAGEELAWRGFLQQILTRKFGNIKGIVLLGFIWSMWHLPAQLAGYNYPVQPLLGSLLLSPVELIATSFFLGWLTLKCRSFIAAAFAHGAGNSIQEGVTANLKLNVPHIYESLISLFVTVLIGLIFAYLLGNKKSY